MGGRPRLFASTPTRIASALVALAIAIGTQTLPTAVSAQTPECPTGGEITITRNYPTYLPTPATFTYEVRGPNSTTVVDTVAITFDAGHNGTESSVAHTPPGATGSYDVVETGRPDGFAPAPHAAVVISESTACSDGVSFDNTQPVPTSSVRVVKTETVGRRVRDEAIGKWTFTLAGPGDTSITKRTNTNGSRHVLKFRSLLHGEYTLCESFSGWRSNLGNGSGYITPNGDRCVDFVLGIGEVRTYRVNNRCPLS